MSKHTPNILEHGDARWLASVIDCEGSICCVGSARGLRCAVTMVNNKMVMECFRIAGCGVLSKFILKSGRTAWSWYIIPSYGRVIIEQVIPYLIEKKEQAEIFIMWPLGVQRRRLPGYTLKERAELVSRLRYLNHSEHQHQPNYEHAPIKSCVIQATL